MLSVAISCRCLPWSPPCATSRFSSRGERAPGRAAPDWTKFSFLAHDPVDLVTWWPVDSVDINLEPMIKMEFRAMVLIWDSGPHSWCPTKRLSPRARPSQTESTHHVAQLLDHSKLHLRRNLLLPQKMALLRQQLWLDLATSNVLKSWQILPLLEATTDVRVAHQLRVLETVGELRVAAF